MGGILCIMIGLPASGKSTFVRDCGCVTHNDKCVSRDEIRFSLISDTDEYFAKEDIVFNTFVKEIGEGLQEGKTVYADATHLNRKSRSKLLNALTAQGYMENVDETYAIFMHTYPYVCKERNALREGRARVPDNVIDNMYKTLQPPTFEEPFNCIIAVDDKKILITERKV